VAKYVARGDRGANREVGRDVVARREGEGREGLDGADGKDQTGGSRGMARWERGVARQERGVARQERGVARWKRGVARRGGGGGGCPT
jgi:hypothetical protein